jgi:hypothetical protein
MRDSNADQPNEFTSLKQDMAKDSLPENSKQQAKRSEWIQVSARFYN